MPGGLRRSAPFLALMSFLALAAPASALMIVRLTPRVDEQTLGPVVTADRAPPPISGGTLSLTRDATSLVVSDPDRDRVLVVDLAGRSVTAEVTLPEGAEPGRNAVDARGWVHVALRGSGELLSFSLRRPNRASRREVCPMPRGVAVRGRDVLVACRGGELVTLRGGRVRRRTHLDDDLRDVVVAGGRVHVTRFRSAELLTLDEDGGIATRRAPPVITLPAHDEPHRNEVAWRALGLADGRVMVAHQRASRELLSPGSGGYGGSGGACVGAVTSTITVFPDDGPGVATNVHDAALPVDFSVDPTDGEVLLVAAGNRATVRPIVRVPPRALEEPSCVSGSRPGAALYGAIAVVYLPDGRSVVQRRDPAELVVLAVDGTEEARIALGGADAFDTGHAVFHTSTDARLACATCHPEGGEDGHVWRVRERIPVRTPALHGAAGTAPFHWQGEFADFRALMAEVFERRMRGRGIGVEHAEAVERWLGTIPPPRSARPDEDAVSEGRAVFERACAGCHEGNRTSNAEVGTGGAFQAPRLTGVRHRLPVMHDGCATTLRERFDPTCGGRDHGPELEAAEIEALLGFLETL